jgi:hypothetical protein
MTIADPQDSKLTFGEIKLVIADVGGKIAVAQQKQHQREN